MPKPKKPLSPQAAKLLEQYRNAGKTPTNTTDQNAPIPEGTNGGQPRLGATPPSGGASMRRSGMRGK
jgi:hypothetical protein